jgi:GMP synthase PP-ATPase subunit
VAPAEPPVPGRAPMVRSTILMEQVEQDFVLLADVCSVGVQGDGRSYAHPLVLRPVTSEDAMTADWARPM